MKRKECGEDRSYRTVCYGRLCNVEEFVGTINGNGNQFMVHDNVVYEKVSHSENRVDFDSIPEHVRDDLAMVTLDFVRRMMQEPSTREKIEARIQSKKEFQQK